MARNTQDETGHSKRLPDAANNKSDAQGQYGRTISAARENPIAKAAAVGGAVAAGFFLWARRNQISDQIGNIAEQISDWREGAVPGTARVGEGYRNDEGFEAGSTTPSQGEGRSQVEIAQEALTLKELGTAV